MHGTLKKDTLSLELACASNLAFEGLVCGNEQAKLITLYRFQKSTLLNISKDTNLKNELIGLPSVAFQAAVLGC